MPTLPDPAPGPSAAILPWPTPRVTRPAVPLRRYDLAAMAQLLGWDDVQPRTVIQRLRALARRDGLPLPCTARARNGRRCTGADAICASSQWDAQLVDAWHHNPGPAAPAAGLPPVPPAARAAMAGRARAIAGGRA